MLRVRLLGGFEIWLNDRAILTTGWPLRRAKALVKLLALAPNYRLHRDEVVDCLWPESPVEAASHSLHQTLYVARRVLGLSRASHSPLLQLHDELVILGPEAEVSTDLRDFEEAASVARHQHHLELCRRALALYGGELLPGDRYNEWSKAPRDRARSIHLALLWETARLLEERQEYASAAGVLEELVATDGFLEEAYRALMRCYALGGQRTLALRRYTDLKRTLAHELSVEPDESTQALYNDILSGRVSGQRSGAPALEPATRVPGGQPPAKAPTTLRSNLHRSTTSLVGTRLIDDLIDEVQGNRLVTLIGPDGSGKTRLATEAAVAMVPEFPHGAWMVDAGAVPDGETLRRMVFDMLRVHPEAAAGGTLGQPDLGLQGRQILLVLDGCQEIPDASAALVREVLQGSRGVKVLATGDGPAGIPGEVTWRLPRLSLPPADAAVSGESLLRFEGTRLLLERMEAFGSGRPNGRDDLMSVAALARRLDGLPLGIELTAALLGQHGFEGMAVRPGGSPRAAGRPEEWWPDTLDGCIELSYRLLPAAEQGLLGQLTAFEHLFTLGDLPGMRWDDPDSSRVVAALESLVRSGLLTRLRGPDGTLRHRVPRAVRRYTRGLTSAAESAPFRQRHLTGGPPGYTALFSTGTWPGMVALSPPNRLPPFP